MLSSSSPFFAKEAQESGASVSVSYTLRHWVLQWLKLVSWYYTVQASDYVTIEEALSSPAVATDWRAQKDVNSALAALVLSALVVLRVSAAKSV